MNLRMANLDDWRRIKDYVATLPWSRDGITLMYRVAIDEIKPTRSIDQNSRMWALVTAISKQAPDFMGGEWHSPEVWHTYCKTRFLGVESGPYGCGIPKSTTKLKVAEFSDYMTQIEVWAYDEFPGFQFEYEDAA